MACLSILEMVPDLLVCLAGRVISKPSVLEHVHKRKIVCNAKSKLLYLQMTMLKVDSAYAPFILSMQTAELCYTQPLNTFIFIACKYSFETNPFYEIYLSIKDLKIFG